MAEQEQPQPAVYRLTEVAQHNTSRGENKSIWTVIHDKVYDITQFLDEHPGGEEILIENAGIDSTEAFEDVGHSSDAREMLEQYYKGASHHCLVTKQCLVSGVAALSLQGNCMKRTGRGPQTGEPRPGAGRGRPVRRRKAPGPPGWYRWAWRWRPPWSTATSSSRRTSEGAGTETSDCVITLLDLFLLS